jgi:hypothetical protein
MADLEFPETLFDRVRSGNCVLLTGVRFSTIAGLPGWDGLLSKLLEKLGSDDGTVAKLISEGKFLSVAGYLPSSSSARSPSRPW